MADKNTVEIKVIADASGVKPGMQDAVSAVEDGAKRISAGLQGSEESAKAFSGALAALKFRTSDEIRGDIAKLDASLKTLAESGKLSGADLAAAQQKHAAEVRKLKDELKEPTKPGFMDGLKGAGSSAEGMIKSLNGAMAAAAGFMAVIAAGGAMKGAIDAATGWNSEVGGLAKSLGITTEEASAYAVAARQAGVDSDTLAKTTAKLTEVIAQGGPQLGQLGVKARDASGAIRPMGEVLSDTMTKIAAIKNPSEQAAAGIRVFGGEWKELSGVMKLNANGLEEARKKAEALGLVVGPDAAAAGKEYKQNLREIGLVGQSLSVQLGNMLLPAVAEVGKWIATNGPMISEGFKAALGAVGPIFTASVDVLRTAFEAAKSIVTAVVDAVAGAFSALGEAASAFSRALGLSDGAARESVTGMQLLRNAIAVVQAAFIGAATGIKASFVIISEVIGGLADLAGAVAKSVAAILHGDFEGAKAAWGDFYEQAAKRSEAGTEKLRAIAQKGGEDIQKALMQEAPEPKAKSKAPESGGGSKKAVTMADLEAQLTAEKMHYAKSQAAAGTYYAYSQQQEVAFWASKAATFEQGSQDRITLDKKVADMRLAIQTTANSQEKQAAQIRADAMAAQDTAALDAAISSGQAQVAIGQMSAGQLAQLQVTAETRRTEIMRAGLEKRIEIMRADPAANPAEIAAGMKAIQDLEASQGAKIAGIRAADNARQLADEQKLAEQRMAAHEAASLAQIDIETTAKVKELESVRAGKAEILEAERAAEQRRLELRQQFADARIAMLKDRPSDAQDIGAIEAAEEQKRQVMQTSAEKIKALNAQIKAESPWQSIANDMEGSFGKAMEGISSKTMTMRDAMKAVWTDLATSFVKKMVIEPLAQMGIRYIKETALYQAIAGTQVATQTAASVAVKTEKSAETTAVVSSNAAQAGAGAAASQAPIPIIGPALAIAAMIAIAAKVRSLKSAKGGYDIGDEEPLTQLHAREMVLPQRHADTIRGMGDAPEIIKAAAAKITAVAATLAGGGAAPAAQGRLPGAAMSAPSVQAGTAGQDGGGSVTIQISAMDGADVLRVLTNNTRALGEAFKRARRNGDLSPA